MDIGKIEYRVRKIERYEVTRYHEDAAGTTGGVDGKGTYDNPDIAFEVGYALCRAEHERLGLPPGDERVVYPRHPNENPVGAIIGGPDKFPGRAGLNRA